MPRSYKKVTIEDARIMFKNFAGSQTKFNPAGARNFCVVIPEEHEEGIRALGYNVRHTQPREEGDDSVAYLKVNVSYRFDPPHIEAIVGGRKRQVLGEEDISMLDWADISFVDLSFTGSDWEVRGDTGTSAYLDSLYAHIEEDELQSKYADIPYGD